MNTGRHALDITIQRRLRTLQIHLEIVHAGAVVSVAALRYQRAEQDEEVARVLQFCVADKLGDQLERLAALIDSLPAEDAALPSDSIRECFVGSYGRLAANSEMR